MRSYDYALRQGIEAITWERFAALATDALVLFPWDRRVYLDGRWQPHPELVEALALPGSPLGDAAEERVR